MSQEQESASLNFKKRLPSMVSNANIEIIPFKKVWETVDVLHRGANVAVTSSPSKGIETTLKFVPELKNKGFRVIPHIAARSVRNVDHLKEVSEFLEEQAIDEVFVIGGDNESPVGDYSYSSKMLEDLLNINKGIKSVGVGGYPEGHPKIDYQTLISNLRDKIKIANDHNVEIHINTQACYDPKKILGWIKNLHSIDVNTPIFLGVPTPTDMLKLAQISKDIGVGDSISFLKLTGVGSALKSMTYDPTALLQSLAEKPESESIRGLHVFTFNNLPATVDWQDNFKLRPYNIWRRLTERALSIYEQFLAQMRAIRPKY